MPDDSGGDHFGAVAMPLQFPQRFEDSAYSSIHCIGVSHRTAPAGLREALAFAPGEIATALRAARCNTAVERLVIVSTCHRTELYVDISPARGVDAPFARIDDAKAGLANWLTASRSVDRKLLDSHAYALHGDAAVRHLFRLAAGLDSVVPGEPQIVSQVAGALSQSVAAHAASPALKKMFKAAVRAGERAQASVWGGLRAADLGTAAVAAASRLLQAEGLAFEHARVAVFGAGELACLALAALVEFGARDVTVLNRTADRATSVAAQHGVHARPLDEMAVVLVECDIAIFALAASKFIVNAAAARLAMDARGERPLTLIDVALPRNVDAGARSVPGVRLVGIDELGTLVQDLYANRTAVSPDVDRIVEGEQAALYAAESALSWTEPLPARA